jgi:four helix bundle protein
VEKPHKKLDVWQMAMNLVIEIYRITESFPKEEKYGLSNQLKRAAVSVPSNIAEGAARNTKKEFVNYLHMAQASLSELDTQVEVARRLAFLDRKTWEDLDGMVHRVDKMLTGLIRHQSAHKSSAHA